MARRARVCDNRGAVSRRVATARLGLVFALALAFAAPAAAQTLTITPNSIPESATTTVTYSVSGFTVTGAGGLTLNCPEANFWINGSFESATAQVTIASGGTASGSVEVRATGVDSAATCTMGVADSGKTETATTTLTIQNTDGSGGNDPPGGSGDNDPQPQPTNGAPTVTIAAASTTVAPGGTVVLTATAEDSDGRVTSYRWAASRGTFSTREAAETVWTAPERAGRIAVQVTVHDNDGATARATATIMVDAAVPVPALPAAGLALLAFLLAARGARGDRARGVPPAAGRPPANGERPR